MNDLITLRRGTLERALDALRAALEQPEPPPEAQTKAERLAYCAGWWAAMEQKREQPAQEPVAYLYHDASTPQHAHPWLHSTMLVLAADRRPGLRGETPLFTHPPRRDPMTVTDLQQALVDADLVDPDAIDDPEGFDNGFTLQQIDALHSRLMQTTPPTTTTQPEPK